MKPVFTELDELDRRARVASYRASNVRLLQGELTTYRSYLKRRERAHKRAEKANIAAWKYAAELASQGDKHAAMMARVYSKLAYEHAEKAGQT